MNTPGPDIDGRRAMALTTACTMRILAQDEVAFVRDNVLATDMTKRGVALAMLQKAESGKVLSRPEASAIAAGFETRGEPWFHAFQVIETQQKTDAGVRDMTACGRAKDSLDPSACSCDRANCSECGSCPFHIQHLGGGAQTTFSKPKADCGCK